MIGALAFFSLAAIVGVLVLWNPSEE